MIGSGRRRMEVVTRRVGSDAVSCAGVHFRIPAVSDVTKWGL